MRGGGGGGVIKPGCIEEAPFCMTTPHSESVPNAFTCFELTTVSDTNPMLLIQSY